MDSDGCQKLVARLCFEEICDKFPVMPCLYPAVFNMAHAEHNIWMENDIKGSMALSRLFVYNNCIPYFCSNILSGIDDGQGIWVQAAG